MFATLLRRHHDRKQESEQPRECEQRMITHKSTWVEMMGGCEDGERCSWEKQVTDRVPGHAPFSGSDRSMDDNAMLRGKTQWRVCISTTIVSNAMRCSRHYLGRVLR